MHTRLVLLMQVAATLAILALVPGNAVKLAAFLLVWTLTFRRIGRAEAIFGVVVCIFFTAMNAASLRQGIFAFSQPDLLGMPVYELVMWGFYLLHTKRMLGGPAPAGRRFTACALAVLFALAFATLSDAHMLLGATVVVLLAAFVLFHEGLDLAYAGYMVLLGAAVEYTGVLSGQWSYPGDPPGGVPLWFITMWGGVGLFLRRLALPFLETDEGWDPSRRS